MINVPKRYNRYLQVENVNFQEMTDQRHCYQYNINIDCDVYELIDFSFSGIFVP